VIEEMAITNADQR